ncbi:hypothetical protein D7B24_007281 [Verticillium nonalfalfae]|uniref:37S ribosomal protein S18, mitochondrial n=1 Tax=Verticillium nonalfalfae TaxID=1051616 RepID=A0A3M9Y8E3_9PEZI|nr:uncharacterized protein D7B24_007281 [Verticillium nonalfalfae]RNJ56445.1 hypothetical protein D7B24_007281 [Verticillium nonalfalfae]
MSGPSASRFLARTAFQSIARPTSITRCSPSLCRPLSQTPSRRADDAPTTKAGSDLLSSLYGAPNSPAAKPSTPAAASAIAAGPTDSSMMNLFRSTLGKDEQKRTPAGLGSGKEGFGEIKEEALDALEPFHLHIYSHKHNTHVTMSKPDRGAIVSMSCGNIGFKKSRRKHFDAAYQLTAYVFERLRFAGWDKKINRIELVLRGFGQGRDAGVKCLMSPEGAVWRQKVVRVADSTRLKFGGSRSKNPRRL